MEKVSVNNTRFLSQDVFWSGDSLALPLKNSVLVGITPCTFALNRLRIKVLHITLLFYQIEP